MFSFGPSSLFGKLYCDSLSLCFEIVDEIPKIVNDLTSFVAHVSQPGNVDFIWNLDLIYVTRTDALTQRIEVPSMPGGRTYEDQGSIIEVVPCASVFACESQ